MKQIDIDANPTFISSESRGRTRNKTMEFEVSSNKVLPCYAPEDQLKLLLLKHLLIEIILVTKLLTNSRPGFMIVNILSGNIEPWIKLIAVK